jgi:hypothetical protein
MLHACTFSPADNISRLSNAQKTTSFLAFSDNIHGEDKADFHFLLFLLWALQFTHTYLL